MSYIHHAVYGDPYTQAAVKANYQWSDAACKISIMRHPSTGKIVQFVKHS